MRKGKAILAFACIHWDSLLHVRVAAKYLDDCHSHTTAFHFTHLSQCSLKGRRFKCTLKEVKIISVCVTVYVSLIVELHSNSDQGKAYQGLNDRLTRGAERPLKHQNVMAT